MITLTLVAGSAVAAGPPAGAATSRPQQDRLSSVSCVNTTMCFAVGLSVPANSSTIRTLSERWNGKTWARVPSPNPGGQVISRLSGVWCTSASNCLAVGTSLTSLSSSETRALMEQWNGKTWSIVAAPDPTHSLLAAVTCTSATNCFGVGSAIERWNGKNWSIVKTPNAVSLSGVSCSSAASCFAVGGSSSERWNGKSWTPVPTPKTGQEPFESFFIGSVSCGSAVMCFAAGTESEPIASSSPLMEQWNGKTWALVAAPGPAAAEVGFGGMSCPSSTTCFVVGSSSDAFGGRSTPFIDSWAGTAWTTAASPNVTSAGAELNAVSCTSTTNCFAVGDLTRPFVGDTRALVEHWDGAAWSVSGAGTGGAT